MIYFYTNDIAYYRDADNLLEYFKEKKIILNRMVVLPTDEELRNIIKNSNHKEEIAILSTQKPAHNIRDFFVLVKLPNKEGVLTTQQKKFGVDEAIALEQSLGIKIIDPKNLITLKDMSGSTKFIEWANDLTSELDKGNYVKPAIFVGMAGCGKSRGAEAVAGEWNAPLIDLHIPTILMSENPFEKIDDIFEHLSSSQMRVVIRMDELEQMLGDKNMIGKLLTLFNDLNTSKGYKINGILMATANNISELIQAIPQFFRHGRWSEKFFVSYPPSKNAKDMISYYCKAYDVKLNKIEEYASLSEASILTTLVILIDDAYEKHNKASNENRFVYSPSEIDAFVKLLSKMKLNSEKDIEYAINRIKPQQVTASKGTLEMYAKALELSFIDIYDEEE